MHYLEDLIESLEGLPEEIRNRFEQIRLWDFEVEKLRAECETIKTQIFAENSGLPDEEKARLALLFVDHTNNMKTLAQKKLHLTERTSILLEKVHRNAQERLESFQVELAVDSPGFTEKIEQRVQREYERRKAAEFLGEQGTPFESDESARSTPDVLVPNLVDKKNILKERTNKKNMFNQTLEANMAPIEKRKPGRKPADGKISQYMRRKMEKEREQKRLVEIHAQRDEERKKRREAIVQNQAANFNMASFGAPVRNSTPANELKKEPIFESVKDSFDDEEDDGALTLFAGMADLIGPDDQIRDDVDFDPNRFNLLAGLGREEMDIIDSLDDNGVYTLDDDMNSGLGAASTSQSPMYNNQPPFSNITRNSSKNSPAKQVPSTSSSSLSEAFEDRKKKKITFSCTSDTSMHGRPRKLTDRAVQKIQQTMQKSSRKNRDISILDGNESPDEIWCYCQQPSFGCMIACDEEDCPLRWFHLHCAGLATPPEGSWYCNRCRPHLYRSY